MSRFEEFRNNRKTKPLYDTLLFAAITLAVHYLYRFWSAENNFSLGSWQVISPAAFDWFADIAYVQSKWVLNLLLPVNYYDAQKTFEFSNNWTMLVNGSCSGLKQYIQYIILMLLFPGPWRHKLWYIPLGLVIINITNVVRIASLGVILANRPDIWNFAHHYPLRIMFYVVIFILWVIWNDRIRPLKAEVESES